MRVFFIFIILFSSFSFCFDRDPFQPVQRLYHFSDEQVQQEHQKSADIQDSSYDIIDAGAYERVKLMGIIWDDKSPFAVFLFGGAQKFYQNEGVIKGYSIESISETEVYLKNKEGDVVFKVGDEKLL